MGIGINQVQKYTSLESSYIPVEMRRDVVKAGHYVCAFCYRKEKHDICHDLPKCRGGKTELNNLLVCCEECKREKHYQTADEFREERRFQAMFENVHSEPVVEDVEANINFLDGSMVRGTMKFLPGQQTRYIWVKPSGNGQVIWVNLLSVKTIIVRGVKMEDLRTLPVMPTTSYC